MNFSTKDFSSLLPQSCDASGRWDFFIKSLFLSAKKHSCLLGQHSPNKSEVFLGAVKNFSACRAILFLLS